ncbi:MAG: hypothetical protein Q8N23_04745 [Archangium sp.]|nr:hypothetical protein [Archangium sp.]MDP3571365.1 hypothetical protein [Archangium sp.]
MPFQTFQQHTLTLELHDEGEAISLVWSGRSSSREPGVFIVPVLSRALELGRSQNKPLLLDFQSMAYMNSSTITPIIRLLGKAMRTANKVCVIYKKELKWQELSFTALEVFQTPDQRIEIRGV